MNAVEESTIEINAFATLPLGEVCRTLSEPAERVEPAPVVPRDKYDEAVDYLVKYPELIYENWVSPNTAVAGCLFRYAMPLDVHPNDTRRDTCGCLTMVHNCGSIAWTPELTAAIRADNRVPNGPSYFKHQRGDELRATLNVFAEWQRRLDRELRGVQ